MAPVLCFILLAVLFGGCRTQQQPPAAATAANAAAPTWFMQAFEQCGGTGGDCSAQASAGIHACADKQYPGTICPMTFTCQRQSEAFWQCLPQQIQAAANDTVNGTATGANRTAADGASKDSSTYQPAQIQGAGFRRFNVTVWPYCKPWEFAIASRCVPANRTRRAEDLQRLGSGAGRLRVRPLHGVLPVLSIGLVVAAGL